MSARDRTCHFDDTEPIGCGGYGATKDWYSGFYCSKCKKLYAETSDGRHWTYLRKGTQKYLKKEVVR